MSMVGYVLGLGDRHPSNMMIEQASGRVVHIDFGDCFEVAMRRERYPERVPFRLTRMMVRAMEACGIEGSFRVTCEHTMRLLRSSRDPLMAVLEAFVYDPLINWRLFSGQLAVETSKGRSEMAEGTSHCAPEFPGEFSSVRRVHRVAEILRMEEESVRRPEGSNSSTISLISRVHNKLTGRDFEAPVDSLHAARGQILCSAYPSAGSLEVSDARSVRREEGEGCEMLNLDLYSRGQKPQLSVCLQVDRLIREASSVENLCQAYVGWCAFW
jgi:FKBP12-rapamycin complex-associated protein